MKEVGVPGAEIEDITIQTPINGTKEKGSWNEFRTSLVMPREAEYLYFMKLLEDIMTSYANTNTEVTDYRSD